VVKRKGEPDVHSSFSVSDAKRAGLWGKQGPWSQYPKRMLQLRARAFALRDAFPDALRGLASAEEEQDTITVTAEVIEPEKPRSGVAALKAAMQVEAAPEPTSDPLAESLQREVIEPAQQEDAAARLDAENRLHDAMVDHQKSERWVDAEARKRFGRPVMELACGEIEGLIAGMAEQ
jgi:hypothetical protein